MSLQTIILIELKKDGTLMAKFKIDSQKLKRKSINRSVRFSPEMYDKLVELSKTNDISFNKTVASCIDYALSNLQRK